MSESEAPRGLAYATPLDLLMPSAVEAIHRQTLEAMVLDCEAFSLLRHLAGIPDAVANTEDTVAILAEVGPGGHFLSQSHTLEKMRRCRHRNPTDHRPRRARRRRAPWMSS